MQNLMDRIWTLEHAYHYRLNAAQDVQTPFGAETKPDTFSSLESDVTKIIAIVDGDGHIFNTNFIKRAKQGGIEAAKLLTDSLTSSYLRSGDYYTKQNQDDTVGLSRDLGLDSNNAIEHIQLWKDILWRFVYSFVHSHMLYRSITGGHDSGYSATLQVLQDEGLLNKVVLLQGYKNMAMRISSFQLPELVINGLFMEEPLAVRISKTSSTVPDSDGEREDDDIGLSDLVSNSHASSISVSEAISLSIANDIGVDGNTKLEASLASIQIPAFSLSNPSNNESRIDLKKIEEMIENMSPTRRRSETRRRGGNNDGNRGALSNKIIREKIRLQDRPSVSLISLLSLFLLIIFDLG
ncbi:hypothetical protein Clacol_004267 [Clathrus columnatus]|uniref:DUF7923 domain-containing protein n=1 Tax=Clathrus columnatus TaxID=1419009 RepID=A0AAV5AC28_9AGAM|nr:hypothetical protein Clacol_004267 [Clathrus columnatus]